MMKVESSKFVFNKNTKYSKSVRPCSSISCVHWNRNIGHPPSRQIVYKGTNIIFGYFYVMVNMFHLFSIVNMAISLNMVNKVNKLNKVILFNKVNHANMLMQCRLSMVSKTDMAYMLK